MKMANLGLAFQNPFPLSSIGWQYRHWCALSFDKEQRTKAKAICDCTWYTDTIKAAGQSPRGE